MSGGRDGMLGVVVSEMGLGSGRTKRGGWWVVDVVEVWNCGAGTGSEGSSSSNVGWRGVAGGEVGDGESEDMIYCFRFRFCFCLWGIGTAAFGCWLG